MSITYWIRNLAQHVSTHAWFIIRVWVGALLIHDAYSRMQHVDFFYTENGVLNRQELFSDMWASGMWSIHTWFGTREWTLVLSGIACALGICIIAGKRVRLCALISWGLLLSVHTRNQLNLQAADIALRVLVWWIAWGYMGDQHTSNKRTSRLLSVLAYYGLTMQIVGIYFFAGIYKLYPEWFTGEDLRQAFSLASFARWWTQELVYSPLVPYIARMVIVIELAVPLLLFLPHGRARDAGFLILALITCLFGIMFDLGPFPITLLCALFTIYWMGDAYQRESKRKTRISAESINVRIISFVLLCSTLIVGYWNLKQFLWMKTPLKETPWIIHTLGLNQKWYLFSPPPPYEIHFVPQFRTGSEWRNLWEKNQYGMHPHSPRDFYQNDRLHHYFAHIESSSSAKLIGRTLRGICAEAMVEHPTTKEVRLWGKYMSRTSGSSDHVLFGSRECDTNRP